MVKKQQHSSSSIHHRYSSELHENDVFHTIAIYFSPHSNPSLDFCNKFANRLVINKETSMNLFTQLFRHNSVRLSNLLLGFSMHLSQQTLLNS